MDRFRRLFLLAIPTTLGYQCDESAEKPWRAVLDSLNSPKFLSIEIKNNHEKSKSDGIDGTPLGWRLNDFSKVSLDEKTMEKASQFKENEAFFLDVVNLCRSEDRLQSFGAVILLNCVYPECRFVVKIDPFTINSSLFIRLHAVSTNEEKSHILHISQKTFGAIAADHWMRVKEFGMIAFR